MQYLAMLAGIVGKPFPLRRCLTLLLAKDIVAEVGMERGTVLLKRTL
jgi:hypothetical protein